MNLLIVAESEYEFSDIIWPALCEAVQDWSVTAVIFSSEQTPRTRVEVDMEVCKVRHLSHFGLPSTGYRVSVLLPQLRGLRKAKMRLDQIDFDVVLTGLAISAGPRIVVEWAQQRDVPIFAYHAFHTREAGRKIRIRSRLENQSLLSIFVQAAIRRHARIVDQVLFAVLAPRLIGQRTQAGVLASNSIALLSQRFYALDLTIDQAPQEIMRRSEAVRFLPRRGNEPNDYAIMVLMYEITNSLLDATASLAEQLSLSSVVVRMHPRYAIQMPRLCRALADRGLSLRDVSVGDVAESVAHISHVVAQPSSLIRHIQDVNPGIRIYIVGRNSSVLVEQPPRVPGSNCNMTSDSSPQFFDRLFSEAFLDDFSQLTR